MKNNTQDTLGGLALLCLTIFLLNCLVDVFKLDKQQAAKDLITISQRTR